MSEFDTPFLLTLLAGGATLDQCAIQMNEALVRVSRRAKKEMDRAGVVSLSEFRRHLIRERERLQAASQRPHIFVEGLDVEILEGDDLGGVGIVVASSNESIKVGCILKYVTLPSNPTVEKVLWRGYEG